MDDNRLPEMAKPDALATELALQHLREENRAAIALEYGPAALAIYDQYDRAMTELGVSSAEQAERVQGQIEGALIGFQFRGFPTGHAPSPTELKAAIRSIADHFCGIEKDLSVLFTAWRGVGHGNDDKATKLDYIHRLILGNVAEHVLPRQLRSKFSPDDIAEVMPQAALLKVSNPWNRNFQRIGEEVMRVHDAFDVDELRNPTRQLDETFVNFVHRLALIYTDVTGALASASDAKPPQSSQWHSPFSRFFRLVWPMTLEGSAGQHAPSDARIRAALEATPTF
jgi:hypothetical protein